MKLIIITIVILVIVSWIGSDVLIAIMRAAGIVQNGIL